MNRVARPLGLIPAWAGKTWARGGPPRGRRAHPRVGGENVADVRVARSAEGSSPRGRGKLSRDFDPGVTRGLIPAWAGKTVGLLRPMPQPWAHPRVGGENQPNESYEASVTGSSPRGRGKPAHACVDQDSVGLIPAWAGKTMSAHRGARRRSAHPRVGGENAQRGFQPRLREGSSPRGRGKPLFGPFGLSGGRLIPAWAGKTRSMRSISVGVPAHPRVGGENRAGLCCLHIVYGSSPRGRGKPRSSVRSGVTWGLIPAWAGKTPSAPGPVLHGRAHPRVGGENRVAFVTGDHESGSSPRGRGKRSSR